MSATLEPPNAQHLADAELRWRRTIDNAPMGIGLVGLDGRWLHVNPAFCELMGYAEQELVLHSFRESAEPDEFAEDLRLAQKLLDGEIDRYSLDKRRHHADGHRMWIRQSVSLARTPAGEPLHFIVHIEDVTEQRRTSQRLSGIIASARAAFLSVDITGRITEWNAAAEALFGWTRAEVLGRNCSDLIVPAKHREAFAASLGWLAASGETRLLAEKFSVPLLRRDGVEFPAEVNAWCTEDDANEIHSFIRDLSNSLAARRVAMHEAERQAALIEAQLDLAQVELTPSMVMQRICEKARELTGAEHATIEIREGDEIVYRAAIGRMEKYLDLRLPVDKSISGRSVLTGQALICNDAYTDPRVDQESCRKLGLRSMLLTPLRHGDEVVGVLKVLSGERDYFTSDHREILGILAGPFASMMSNAWRLESTAKRSASDPLTGLANRGHVLTVLKRAVEVDDISAPIGVLFIDLDGFKAVNDRHGHAAGDELLAIVAQRMKAAVRPTDVVGRLGGDEFLIVGVGLTSLDRAEALAQRLITSISAPYQLRDGITAKLGASVGVALARSPASGTAVLAVADEAMYEAKRQGGMRYSSRVLEVSTAS